MAKGGGPRKQLSSGQQLAMDPPLQVPGLGGKGNRPHDDIPVASGERDSLSHHFI
jgi:hypothetical protein